MKNQPSNFNTNLSGTKNNQTDAKGLIAWMAGNSVAANLLMLFLLIGGLFAGFSIKQEVFPEFSMDQIQIMIPYPGASPEEVESGIVIAVEEAIHNLDGIDEINSSAKEGSAIITINAIEGTDVNKLWQELQSEVSRITTFPAEAEEPMITILERDREIMKIALYGNIPETTICSLAEQVKDQLLTEKNITRVEFEGMRDREIHVEITSSNLRRYNITLQEIAEAISEASVELGGGAIQARSGDILLRVKDRRDYALEYAKLPIMTQPDGSRILLGDIAKVSEGFADSNVWGSFNAKRAVIIAVYREGNATPKQVSESVRSLIDRLNTHLLPDGVGLKVVNDMSEIFTQRANLLIKNAYFGLALVFILLGLFLDIRLAFWVSLGIPISFLGSFLFLVPAGFSLNMVSMFAFIITLGIVVDDAVVVGENIYFYRRQGLPLLHAAIQGAQNIAVPIFFSVITNMVTFIPLLFVPGFMGKVFKALPFVVISVFGISLIESLFILPTHLSGRRRTAFFPLNYLETFQESFANRFENFVKNFYDGLLTKILEYRYTTISFSIAIFLISLGFVSSGRMGMVLFPKVESDYAHCEVNLPYGTSKQNIKQIEDYMIQTAISVVAENGGDKLSDSIFSVVKDNQIVVDIYLTEPEIRPLSTSTLTRLWRDKTGPVLGVEAITFKSDRGGPGSGKNLTVSLSHLNNTVLNQAGKDLAGKLEQYDIVYDIDDGSAQGKEQFDITMTSEGMRMGLTARNVANQIRHSFQGITAVKQQRGSNEVTVVVRLDQKERFQESAFEELVLQSPTGEILLRDAVKITKGRAYTTIQRADRKREILVTANVRPPSHTESLLKEISKKILPELVANYPGLTYEFAGAQSDIRESLSSLIKGMGFALLSIFALLAVLFRSYSQPLIIMFCIPFGMIGAIAGHLIMGYSLSVMSMFGLVAMSGVVINNALILIELANRAIHNGEENSAFNAIQRAGIQRFRPILLTTLTTCGGLAPIISETSIQARFLIPMAISLGFGVLFATLITLFMVPCLYLIIDDFIKLLKN